MNLQQRNLVTKTHSLGTRYTLSAEYLPKYLNWDRQDSVEGVVTYLNQRTGLDWTNLQFDWDGVSVVN